MQGASWKPIPQLIRQNDPGMKCPRENPRLNSRTRKISSRALELASMPRPLTIRPRGLSPSWGGNLGYQPQRANIQAHIRM